MRCYFKKVLDGFILEDMEIALVDEITKKADFMLGDLDDDDMPEIVMLFSCDNKGYWAVLDRKDFVWSFNYISEQKSDDGVEWDKFLKQIEVAPEFLSIGRNNIRAEQILPNDDIVCVALVDNKEYVINLKKAEKDKVVDTPETDDMFSEEVVPAMSKSIHLGPPVAPLPGDDNFVAPLPDGNKPVAPLPDGDNPVAPLPGEGNPVAPLPGDFNYYPVPPIPNYNFPKPPNYKYTLTPEYKYPLITPDIASNGSIIRQVQGNVMNSNRIETITLTGANTKFGANYYDNLTLLVQDGDKYNNFQILLPIEKGYNPTLKLVNFTDRSYKDIVVTFELDSNGMKIGAFIYSFSSSGRLKLVFDSRNFNEEFGGMVTYQDFYRVVINASTGNEFILDISSTSPRILNELYYSNGMLKAPRRGMVLGLSSIRFVQNNFDYLQNLVATQPVGGFDMFDIIANIETEFVYNQNDLLINGQNAFVNGINNIMPI